MKTNEHISTQISATPYVCVDYTLAITEVIGEAVIHIIAFDPRLML